MGLKLAQIREEKTGEPAPKGIKTWFKRNKGVVLIGTAAVIVVGGYMGYKYLFKKKDTTPSIGASTDTGDLGSSTSSAGVEFS